jgi:hypothetical protein
MTARRVMMGAVFGAAMLALAPASALAAGPVFASHPTTAQIDAAITRYGAHDTVNALFDQNRWDYVADEIGKGTSAWVALAVRLAPGADAGTAEELPISLGFALPINPGAVLLAIKSGAFDVGDVCDAPFIDGTIPSVPAYIRKATAAVRKVSDPSLAATKAACLATLAKANS